MEVAFATLKTKLSNKSEDNTLLPIERGLVLIIYRCFRVCFFLSSYYFVSRYLNNDSLSSIVFRPLHELKKKFTYDHSSSADALWTAGWLLAQKEGGFIQYNWKGHMKSIHATEGSAKSRVEYLPIINAKPDSFGAIFTTLVECINETTDRPVIITFDFPLWIKAVRITLDLGLPVIPRLGGFHLLKSFLGCIGYIMKDSGIEDVFQVIYQGADTVDNILSGSAYYKALRAHFLVDAALCSVILEQCFTEEDLEHVEEAVLTCRSNKLGSSFSNAFTIGLEQTIKRKLEEVSGRGGTAKLWIRYHHLVQMVKDFIRAERLSDFKLHLSVVCEMLPTFAAAGHSQYYICQGGSTVPRAYGQIHRQRDEC